MSRPLAFCFIKAAALAALMAGAVAAGTPPLAKAWSASLGTLIGAPVLTPDESALLITGYDGKLYAFDPATGDATWASPIALPAPATCSLAFAPERGVAFVVLSTGAVALVELRTGAVVNASIGTLGPYATGEYACQPLYVHEVGMLYVSYYDTIYAMNATTGAVAWTGWGSSEPTFVSGLPGKGCKGCTVWVGADTGHLSAYDAVSGTLLGRYNSPLGPAVGFGRPRVKGSSALFSSSKGLNLVSFATPFPTLVYNLPKFAAPSSDVALGRGGDVAYVGTAAGQLVAVNAWTDGKAVWSSPLNAAAGGTPTLVGEHVYVTDVYGGVYAFDAANGTLVVTANVSSTPHEPAMPASTKHGLVFVSTWGGYVAAYTLATGSTPPTPPAPTTPQDILMRECGGTTCSIACHQLRYLPGRCELQVDGTSKLRECNANATSGATALTVSSFAGIACEGKPLTSETFTLGTCNLLQSGASLEVVQCPAATGLRPRSASHRH